ncbi:hypothetical protein ACS3QZ_14210 [Shimia sp. W99]
MQKILHNAKRKRETDLQRYSQADDFRARFEIAKRRSSGPDATLQNRPTRLKPVFFDSTMTEPFYATAFTERLAGYAQIVYL